MAVHNEGQEGGVGGRGSRHGGSRKQPGDTRRASP